MAVVVKTLEKKLQDLAERAIEDAECGAQFEIKDETLREALFVSIIRQLRNAYELNV